MANVYIVRHGQTDWNIEGRLNSTTETKLNDNGEAQARQFASLFHSAGLTVPRIFCSTTERAVQTATIISSIVETPYEPIAVLREVDFGIFEGKTYDEINGSVVLKNNYDKWLSGAATDCIAEDLKSCTRRIEAAYELIGAQDCLVITHGVFARMLILHTILGDELSKFRAVRLDNLSVSKIETGDRPRLIYLNSRYPY